jgi:hypothetical protein
MKLTNILREMGEDENNSQSMRNTTNLVLITKATPMSEVEEALNDLDNYGSYAAYAQSNNTDIKKIKDAWFGPTGGPNVKVAAAKKTWNASDREWRKLKIEDIKKRLPDVDTTGWEEFSYDELPKEAKNWKVFFATSTKDAIDDIVKKMTSNVKILNWYEENGMLIFPRESNETIPSDVTLEKIIKTVMKNAGITDARVNKKQDDGEGGSTLKAVSRFTQIKIPVESKAEISALRKELQAKFPIPTASYRIKEDENGVYLLIANITIQQKANITFYLEDKGLMEGMSEDFRRLQVLAGIIK